MQASFQHTPTALHALLDMAFDTELPVVAPSYSKYGEQLTYLGTAHDARAYLEEHARVDDPLQELAICYPSMRGTIVEQRVALDPQHCHGHTFRYRLMGWGMIHLYLDFSNASAITGRISMNSEKRATIWEPQYPELGPAAAWDWKAVGQHGRRLIRMARKSARH